MNFQNIIIAFGSILLGFILKIIHGKIFDKRVFVHHELENPAEFRLPKQVSFQNLRIWNTGKLPANDLRVNLDKKIIEESQVEYKSNTEDRYEKEVKEDILILRFAKLRPKEELIVSFLSEKPLDPKFLLSVKSDEMVSIGATKEARPPIGNIVGIIFLVLFALFGFLNLLDMLIGPKGAFSTFPRAMKKSPIALSVSTSPTPQMKGQKMDVSFVLENKSNEMLADIELYFQIAEVWREKEVRNFLNKGEQVTYKKIILIPKDIPSGSHRIRARAFVSWPKDELVMSEAEAWFSVQ